VLYLVDFVGVLSTHHCWHGCVIDFVLWVLVASFDAAEMRGFDGECGGDMGKTREEKREGSSKMGRPPTLNALFIEG
jgi:hypothetical protein